MAKKVINVFTLVVVTQCVLNQSQGYWLQFDAIVATITMCSMMENNNVGGNEPIQVCDLLFHIFMLMFLIFELL
jgi:hypothetical protein